MLRNLKKEALEIAKFAGNLNLVKIKEDKKAIAQTGKAVYAVFAKNSFDEKAKRIASLIVEPNDIFV